MKKKLAVLLLFLLLAGFAVSKFWGHVIFSEIQNLSRKPQIIKPQAQNDPERQLVSLLSDKSIDIVSSPVASESGILVVLAKDETEVLFEENKDIKTQVEVLQIILSKLSIDGKMAKRIDLRYLSPVVTY